jgi:hypothetical protein
MHKIIVLLLLFVVGVPSTMAANIDIKWTDPDSYTDIRPGNNNRKHFREHTFKHFEKHFIKLASQLPEGQQLNIEVINVDLAGSTFYGGINRIRVVSDMHPPRLYFYYQLLNVDQSMMVEGKATLKNMGFMRSKALRYSNDSLGHEKAMLDKWFAHTFSSLLDHK